ncbi:granzyme-like protein [Pimephales promelas]|nr:granzyme-like protein [Pimephales promelas]
MHDGIVGGKVSIPHSRPYMVYIRDSQSKAVCDGFLVREDFVMTAAHCKYSHLKVYLGVNDTNFLPDGVAVDPIPHPHFINNKPGHDIMLLKVLREANVTLLDSKNCGTKDTLCSAGKIGPAMGDSGGPLVCGDVAQGIVSYYRLESNGDHCTRYTDISKYLPWIHDKMNKSESGTSSREQQHKTWKGNLVKLI